jgi:polyhydroxybutyrate depolymerase
MIHAVRAAAVAAAMCATAAMACPGAEAPCRLAEGEYRIVLPETAPRGAVVFLHGWAALAEGIVLTDPLARDVAARGYALIAPQGVARGDSGRPDWAVRDGRGHSRDDVAFLRAVMDDAAGRFGIDRGAVLLAGFSRGGSFVWDAACAAPDLAAAYAAVAGGFWRPHPAACAGPVRLHHTHGFSDTVVPLEGRRLREDVAQADVFAGLDLWRATNGCGSRAGAHAVEGPVWSKRWTDCAAGALSLVLHAGGHDVPGWWAGRVLDWFEAQPG